MRHSDTRLASSERAKPPTDGFVELFSFDAAPRAGASPASFSVEPRSARVVVLVRGMPLTDELRAVDLTMSATKHSASPTGSFAGDPRDEPAGARGGRPSRRDLVTGSLAGATAAGAAALAVVPTEPRTQPVAANDLGYRETDHVRRYYALARH